MTTRHLKEDSRWLLGLLAALVALGPLTVDMYLPAMPAMKQALATDISHMQLTISAYLAGFALFHLLCGPLADRFGRKPILILGTVGFVAASIGCSAATSVEQLIAYRFVQGIGACVGPTLARTVTRDIFGPTRAARALSLIAMLMALAPAIAPTLGAALLAFLPWSSIFIFLAAYGALMIVLIQVFLPESLPQRQSLHPVAIARNYGELIAHPLFLTVTVASSLMYAAMLVYLASSSFVYIDMLGVPVKYFGLIFLTTVIGYIAGSASSARLAGRYASHSLILLGAGLGLASSACMCLGAWLVPESLAALIVPMAFYTGALGLVLPHSMALALRSFPHIAGTASALMGFLQMSLSGIASALVGVFLHDTAMPMTLAMVCISLGTVVLSLRVHRIESRPEH